MIGSSAHWAAHILVFFTFWFSGAIWADWPVSPSDPETLNYYLDRNYNVIRRIKTPEKAAENLLSAADKTPIDVSLFAVPYDKKNDKFAVSKYLNSSDEASTFVVDASGKKQMLIPVRKSDRAAWRLFRTRYGPPRYETKAEKMLSKATYYIHQVDGKGGFFAKFGKPLPLASEGPARSVVMNDVIRAQSARSGNQLLESYAAADLSIAGFHYPVGFRSAEAIRNVTAGTAVLPAHGLLGCEDCLKEIAIRYAGKPPGAVLDIDKVIKKWKNEEYITKLAQETARANLLGGVSFEAHTQNILIDLDLKTGKINGFHFRDLDDVLLDPVTPIVNGTFAENAQLQKLRTLSLHGNFFTDIKSPEAKDIWYHMSIYTGQAIDSHDSGFTARTRYTVRFVEEYLKEAERILGKPIQLSQDAAKVLESLKTVNSSSKATLYTGELTERGNFRNALASIVKSIYEEVRKDQELKLAARMSQLSEQDAKVAGTLFDQALKQQKVAFWSPTTRDALFLPDTKASKIAQSITAMAVRRNIGGEAKNPERVIKSAKSMTQYYTAPIDKAATEKLNFALLDGHLVALDPETKIPMAVTLAEFDSLKSSEGIVNKVSRGSRCLTQLFMRFITP